MSEETAGEEECQRCKGAGFVHPRLPSGKPDFSRVVPCECTKAELAEERLSRLQRYSNLGTLTRLTFDNLNPKGRTGDPASEEMFAQAYEGAKAFANEPQGWLVLTGVSGCGKTHLAVAIANHCIQNGRPALFIVVPDLLDHLRAAFIPSSDISYDELFDQVRNTPLLILDDLGTQSSTPWAREKLYQIINHRYNDCLPTVITTSAPIEKLDERLLTRLTDENLSKVFVMGWEKPSEYDIGDLALPLLREMTFDNFDKRRLNLTAEEQRNLEEAYKLARSFAQAPEGWLVLLGRNGCGKTHLAAAIANYQLGKGKPVFFVVVSDFLDHLRSAFSPESKVTYDELFEKVKKAPLLILDDFGEQSSTPWAQEKLYQVINYRYNARLPTVITTCFALEELESRIGSRMADTRISTPFNIDVPDYRSDYRSDIASSQRRTPQKARRPRSQ